MVIAAHVQHLVALPLVPPVADAIGPMPHFAEVGELLGIQVKEIAWSLVFVAIQRFFLLEGGSLGDPSPSKPEPHCGAGQTQVRSDSDRRLALPSSTYGLDDKAKLMASTKPMRLAGTIPQA